MTLNTRIIRSLIIALFLWFTGGFSTSIAQTSSLKGHDLMDGISIKADDFLGKQKNNIISYIGNVIVKQGDLTFNAHKLDVIFKNETINILKASGGVKLSSPSETIEGNWSLYDLSAKIVTLGGGITLTTKNGAVRGDKLILDLNSGLMKIIGELDENGKKRVTGVFKPSS